MPELKQFLLPDVGGRPEVGRITGRGNTANLEVVLALKPDLILDVGSVNPTYVSLADRVQQQSRRAQDERNAGESSQPSSKRWLLHDRRKLSRHLRTARRRRPGVRSRRGHGLPLSREVRSAPMHLPDALRLLALASRRSPSGTLTAARFAP